jgi:serine/threonine-protein kinase
MTQFEVLPGLEDDYDQIQKIAVGGMAEVYRGRQKHLDRAVAIKRIRGELRSNKDIQERFRREARASANLLHQNLAHVYDYLDSGNGDSCMVMEYIDGWDLAEILERSGPLAYDVAAMIAQKVALGLSYVHSHGMVHRDLKPDNIRISTRGEVKIMDFGIAFDPGEANLTQPGILIGSPHYLSPEQVTGAKLDNRADLFAFGITLYEMIVGKKPFFETDKESVYSRIQKGVYLPPEQLKPDMPPLLGKIISDCLQVMPSRRPRSAAALASALQEFAQEQFGATFETRVRRYLMEKRLLPGNPSLIEVEEKTFPPPAENMSSRLKDGPALKLALLSLLVGLAAGVAGFWAYQRFVPASTAIRASDEPAIPAPPAMEEQETAKPESAKPSPTPSRKPARPHR